MTTLVFASCEGRTCPPKSAPVCTKDDAHRRHKDWGEQPPWTRSMRQPKKLMSQPKSFSSRVRIALRFIVPHLLSVRQRIDSRVVHVPPQMLGAHDVVRPTVGLAGDDRQLRDRSFRVCEEQLRPFEERMGRDGKRVGIFGMMLLCVASLPPQESKDSTVENVSSLPRRKQNRKLRRYILEKSRYVFPSRNPYAKLRCESRYPGFRHPLNRDNGPPCK